MEAVEASRGHCLGEQIATRRRRKVRQILIQGEGRKRADATPSSPHNKIYKLGNLASIKGAQLCQAALPQILKQPPKANVPNFGTNANGAVPNFGTNAQGAVPNFGRKGQGGVFKILARRRKLGYR